MNTHLSKLLIVVCSFFVFYACVDDGKQNVDPNADSLLSDTQAVVDIGQDVTFKIPSPVELYIFLWEEDAKFNVSALNSPDKKGNYITTATKAMNFGIYASDLAYCTVFGKNQETFKYFKVAKEMADELGLMEGFDDVIAKRIDESLSNSDSLYHISTEAYSNATNFLEAQHQTELLPFILTGAWLESVHISINSVDKFSPENEVVIRITEQRFLLETIVEFFASIKERDAELETLASKLEDLMINFNQLDENTGDIITSQQFKEITSKIEKLRSDYTS